ncbi:hypothetical protein L7F22_015509 [Adiantum nelumboides]|nr:hypothetical protein [Adiantum nelumboides]
MSHKILVAVRDMLELEYPFPIADGRDSSLRRGVEIMEGKDEGVFAWITVNYLLNRNRLGWKVVGRGQGGGPKLRQPQSWISVVHQLKSSFSPCTRASSHGMHPGEHVYELSNFGGKKYTLYQNSYLGYGLMEARKSINSLSFFTYGLTHPDMVRLAEPPTALTAGSAASLASLRVPSPCFAEGEEKKTRVRMQASREGGRGDHGWYGGRVRCV